jgi:hypothetical protein
MLQRAGLLKDAFTTTRHGTAVIGRCVAELGT